MAELLNHTKNRTLVTCTHSNINILCSLHSVCYYFQYWREILPRFNFYVVTRSYSLVARSYALLVQLMRSGAICRTENFRSQKYLWMHQCIHVADGVAMIIS